MSRLRNVMSKTQEKNMDENVKEPVSNPARYGCEILLERTTLPQAKDKSFPNDAYLIWYEVDGQEYIDLTRGTRVRIFDMYYDKYGPGVVKKIDFGYGTVSPKLWKYEEPKRNKRR